MANDARCCSAVSSVMTCAGRLSALPSSSPTVGKQEEAETFWSSCSVPRLFAEKPVSTSAREHGSMCVYAQLSSCVSRGAGDWAHSAALLWSFWFSDLLEAAASVKRV